MRHLSPQLNKVPPIGQELSLFSCCSWASIFCIFIYRQNKKKRTERRISAKHYWGKL